MVHPRSSVIFLLQYSRLHLSSMTASSSSTAMAAATPRPQRTSSPQSFPAFHLARFLLRRLLLPSPPLGVSRCCHDRSDVGIISKVGKRRQVPRLHVGNDYHFVGPRETYSCFLQLKSPSEEDAIRMQPESGENTYYSLGDDLTVEVHDPRETIWWCPCPSSFYHRRSGKALQILSLVTNLAVNEWYGQFDSAKETFEVIADYESVLEQFICHLNPSAMRRLAQKLEEECADSKLRRYCERILRIRSTGWTQGIFANFAVESMVPKGTEWGGANWEIKTPTNLKVHTTMGTGNRGYAIHDNR
ncbi:hypothetical protein RHSIM_Rhsim06G0113700 [Rhododendron simsii]|uniref:Uncharacterized protein n=1 Tax=Rhododendron simsii TaxID=118357 RepID=A0A834LM16_RHOSS|nr:hypothetical protein RHSIM_Rhsim06G0113700 [Rhododendron simsii]